MPRIPLRALLLILLAITALTAGSDHEDASQNPMVPYRGTWLLDVQGHGANVDEDIISDPPNLVKRESGQLLLMKIPGS